jgi:hypothetical protein
MNCDKRDSLALKIDIEHLLDERGQ